MFDILWEILDALLNVAAFIWGLFLVIITFALFGLGVYGLFLFFSSIF